MMDRALILFDVDGTIFNSKSIILDGFLRAFAAMDLTIPTEDSIVRTIGLSLEVAISKMSQKLSPTQITGIASAYKSAVGLSYTVAPFYPGMRRLIGALAQYSHLTLGAATGKNRRGLDPVLEVNGMSSWFPIRQTPDHYPSKPDPSMILDAIKTHGFDPSRVVMIGDTSFDIDMAHNAGVKSIGVGWGYHGSELRAAKPTVLVDCASEIFEAIRGWGII